MVEDLTARLNELRDRPERAGETLMPLVYDELRRLARARLGHEPGPMTLPATALVHEAWLRLVGDGALQWDHLGHFFAAAAEAMRRVAVDYARAARSQKRGGDRIRVETLSAHGATPPPSTDLVDLDQALGRLEQIDLSMARVVKLKYCAGLSNAETAEALELSARTVNRQWTAARIWLGRAMSQASTA
jgi:RNA polymerase sigma factor (TIGR02999 family)